ncbi:MAG: putative transporter substrate-binding protein [Aeromicrobium sp.]|nr:putative transporter substrate-binding protein [Aeromicrobium sp.]
MKRLLLLPVTAVLLLAGCGSSDSSPDDSASDQAWSFTSGNGETVTLDTMPKRIIASGPEAAALLAYGIKPVGIYASAPVDEDLSLKDLDLSGIEILSETYGEVDIEAATGLRPDLIVADWWPAEKAYSGLEAGVQDSSKKLGKLAPIVGIEQGDSTEKLAQGYEDLAKALGADMDDPEIARIKSDFEAARTAFQDAIAAKPDLSVLAVSPSDDVLYVANPELAPELQDWERWGLDVIHPDSPDPDFPYWENLSWENVDKYQPDLLLIDGRTYDSSLKTGESQPTWDTIKAAKAKAYANWPTYWVHTYSEYTGALETLTATIEKADQSIGG